MEVLCVRDVIRSHTTQTDGIHEGGGEVALAFSLVNSVSKLLRAQQRSFRMKYEIVLRLCL